jgi:hypothetical protein
MRPAGSAAQSVAVRVLLDIRRDGDGRVIGHVTPPAGAPAAFCGWLELLHLLEGHADEATSSPKGRRT